MKFFLRFFLATCAVIAALTGANSAAPTDPAVNQAAVEIVRVFKAQGQPGMQAYVQNCYARESASLHCLYLDAAGFQVNAVLAALMNAPRNPFFMGQPYALRILPAMKAAGIGMDQETDFLKHLYNALRPSLYAAYTAR